MTETERQQMLSKIESLGKVLDGMKGKLREDEKEPNILDEAWECREEHDGYEIVCSNNVAISFVPWKKEIAALPDVLRALKMVADAGEKTMKEFPSDCVLFTIVARLATAEWDQITAALRKAGIA